MPKDLARWLRKCIAWHSLTCCSSGTHLSVPALVLISPICVFRGGGEVPLEPLDPTASLASHGLISRLQSKTEILHLLLPTSLPPLYSVTYSVMD